MIPPPPPPQVMVPPQPKVKIFWSFSALGMFENCPRKYWAVKIAKKVSDVNKFNVDGDSDHQMIQHYLQKGLALPPHLQSLVPLFDRVRAAPGEAYVEYAMCLKQDLTVTRFKDFNDGWVRGAGDYVKVNGTLATYLDWKSGKPRSGEEVEDQIDLTALLLFQHFPQVQRVNGGLVYYNHGKVVPHVANRCDAPLLWNKFFVRVKAMEQAKLEDNYPATPNGLCGWCPYKECPHNKMDERLAREAAKAAQS